ncbi:MAG: DNA-directed RNA polymerase subunit B, partial [Candidatus Aenigmatarchaeota archaeon]
MNEYMSLLKSFARDEGLIRFQIESYNDFIENRIPNIIKQIKEIKPEVPDLGEFRIKLGKFKIGKPLGTDIWGPWTKEADGSERPILPQESRIRNLTYSAPMYLEMTPNLNGIDSETITVNFGDLPVMLKSKICPLSKMDRQELIKNGEDPDDPGGYFIVNGTERVLVLIEEISPNKILVESPSTPNVTNIARIHSERDGYIQRHIIERRNDGIIRMNFANVNKIPIVIILRALGLETDKDIITFLSDDPEVQQEFYPNLFETQAETSKDAIEEIADFLKITQKEYRQDKVNKLRS